MTARTTSQPAWIVAIVMLVVLGLLLAITLTGRSLPTPTQTTIPVMLTRDQYLANIATSQAQATETMIASNTTATAQLTVQMGLTMTAVPTATARAAAFLDTLSAGIDGFPLAWPMPPLADQQITDARACDVPALYASRYENATLEQMHLVFIPVNACDYATLAAAYGYRAYQDEAPLPPEARTVYLLSASGNPALVLSDWLVYTDYGAGSLVEAPPVARQTVTTAFLRYSFGGIGYQSSISVIITNADSFPVIFGQLHEDNGFVEEGEEPVTDRNLSGTIDPALVQALGAALTDLVPIDTQFSAIGCYDYYPEWSVQLRFADGSVVSMATNGTNFMSDGGPWQTNIDGQDYMQVSGAFPHAVNAIARALDLPAGATAAMACGGAETFITYAFPDR